MDISLPNKAKAMYSNGRQLASQYNSMRLEVESNALSSLYQPYESFDKRKFDEILDHTEKLLAAGDYEKLVRICGDPFTSCTMIKCNGLFIQSYVVFFKCH